MKFGKVSSIIVLGGSYISIQFLKLLKQRNIKFHYFTSKRQLSDLLPNGISLKKNLIKQNLKFTSTEDINKCRKFICSLTNSFLILGFGEPWKLNNSVLKKVGNRFLDFMGIPMPEYRGGAHYSWMILNENHKGGCFLQNVSKNTIQGYSDSGFYFLREFYNYPKKLSIPNDFFLFSVKKEISFLNRFINSLKLNHDFKLKKINQKMSLNFPRLNTDLNGIIDWSYDVGELNKFINAFSNPYKGASTFYNKRKVYLRNSKVFKKNNFHIYSSGIIVNIFKNKIYVAVKGGILVLDNVTDKNGKDLKKILDVGKRFFTPNNLIEKAKIHNFF